MANEEFMRNTRKRQLYSQRVGRLNEDSTIHAIQQGDAFFVAPAPKGQGGGDKYLKRRGANPIRIVKD